MKKLFLFLLLPAMASADRLGALKSTADVLLTTQSASGLVVTSSGIAFGSGSSTVTSDTTTLSWDNTAKTMSIHGPGGFQAENDALSFYGRLDNRSVQTIGFWGGNSSYAEKMSLQYDAAAFHSGGVDGLFFRSGNGVNGGAGSDIVEMGSDGTIKLFNLTASQFVQTNASKNLVSYDLFNTSPTYNGQAIWSSVQPSTFTALATSSLTFTGSGNASITEPNTVAGQIVLSTAGASVTAGHCAQFGSSMTIVDAGASCGTGSGGGSGGSLVNLSSQFNTPYYSFTGSSNTLSGASNFTNNLSTITITSTATIITSVASMTITNVSSVTATGVSFNYTASTMTISSMSVTSLSGIGSGGITIPSPVTINNTVNTSTLTVTGGAVIPSNSQNFGKSTLNQWFSQMATNQSQTTPIKNNKLSFFVLGDSHMTQPYIMAPFTDWLYSNFGNAGTYMSLSNYQRAGNTYNPAGCTYSVNGSTWITSPQNSSSLGLDDDTLHSSTPTATVIATCPGADTVILHYKIQPNGGTISFSVDGGAAQSVSTAGGSLTVSSITIGGLNYGVHTASVTYTTLGTAGVDVLDYVFYSSSTPGAVMYRVGTYSMQLGQYNAQDATQYQKLLGMLPSTPTVVMLEFGINEEAAGVAPATMIANAHTEMARFRSVYPQIDCVYFSPPVSVTDGSYAFPLSAYEAAWSSAAIVDGCALVDFTAYFSSEPYFSQYYSDGVHLNAGGGLVAGNTLINMFSNVPGNLTPFTYSASSNTVSYGNDQSTNTLSNVVSVGSGLVISSGITNSGVIGNNLSLTQSNTFLIGGTGSAGQNVTVASVTLSGYLQETSKTKAAITALTPSALGQKYYCSDCTTVSECISTGTLSGAWALVTNKAGACQ